MNAVSSLASILEEFKAPTNRIKGMRYDTSVACSPRSIKVGPPTEQYDYEEAVKVALQKISREKSVQNRTFPSTSLQYFRRTAGLLDRS